MSAYRIRCCGDVGKRYLFSMKHVHTNFDMPKLYMQLTGVDVAMPEVAITKPKDGEYAIHYHLESQYGQLFTIEDTLNVDTHKIFTSAIRISGTQPLVLRRHVLHFGYADTLFSIDGFDDVVVCEVQSDDGSALPSAKRVKRF